MKKPLRLILLVIGTVVIGTVVICKIMSMVYIDKTADMAAYPPEWH